MINNPITPSHNYMNNYTLAGMNARYSKMFEIVQRVYPECPASELSRVAFALSDEIESPGQYSDETLRKIVINLI